jgi:hypothetical protein
VELGEGGKGKENESIMMIIPIICEGRGYKDVY